jgi:hypothetical protein
MTATPFPPHRLCHWRARSLARFLITVVLPFRRCRLALSFGVFQDR